MPSLKSLRVRIKSVKSTQQITKTMKMVAAAKVKKAQDACERSRPYADALNRVLRDLAAGAQGASAPLLIRGREQVNVVRLLVFGSERGLCGGFNGQIARKLALLVENLKSEGKTIQLVAVGKKARDIVKNNYPELLHSIVEEGTTGGYSVAERIATEAVADFEAGHCDEVQLLYNKFISVMTQVPTPLQLIPFRADEVAETAQGELRSSVDYEPDEEQILQRLLPLNIGTQIFRAMLESQASEQGARMTAMDSATRNAGDMIKRLSLKYNRQRQATITTEMIEIVSGAEAAA